MKIIKPGKKKNKPLRGTCKECGCRVECLEDETTPGPYDPREPNVDLRYVKCPQCKADYLWVS